MLQKIVYMNVKDYLGEEEMIQLSVWLLSLSKILFLNRVLPVIKDRLPVHNNSDIVPFSNL